MDTLKCYLTLELEPGASAEQVRESYVALTQLWDPHRYIDNPPLRKEAEEKMHAIDEAYQNLRLFLPDLHPLAKPVVEAAKRPKNALERLPSGNPVLPRLALAGFILLIILIVVALSMGLVIKSKETNLPPPPVRLNMESPNSDSSSADSSPSDAPAAESPKSSP